MANKSYPQIDTRLPVIIAAKSGIEVQAQALQTSSKGLAVQCGMSERNLVTPGGSVIRNGKPIELYVRMALPSGSDGAEQVYARCHIAYSRRVARDVCQIGLRYLDFESDSGAKLCSFIESRLSFNAA